MKAMDNNILYDLLDVDTSPRKLEISPPKEAGKDLLKDSSYRYMLQGKGTEAIIKATATRSKKEIQQYHTGSAYIDFEGVRVNIDEYFLPKLNLKLTPLTSKLLQLMLVDATQLLNREAVTEIGLRLNLAEVAGELLDPADLS